MKQTTFDLPEMILSIVNKNGSKNGLFVTIFGDFDAITPMQKEWDDFIERSGGEIFLTFDWCRTWWKYYGSGRDLAIFVVRDGDEICAIVPLFRETLHLGLLPLRVVRLVGSDFMPITAGVAVREQGMDRVVAALVPHMQKRWKWDLLFLGPLCGRYRPVDDLAKAFGSALGASYCFDASTSDVQTYFTVAPDWDSQVAGLASKQRTNLRRTFREVDRRAASLSSVLAASDTYASMFDDFVAMHQTHWQKIGKPGHFVAWPASREFHRETAGIQLAHDRLRLVGIRMNDHTVGYEYLYRFGGTYAWFLNARESSREMESIDFKWIAFKTRVACAQTDGVTSIDGLRGKYDYKLEMGGKLLPVNNIFVYRTNFASRLRVRIFRRTARWLHRGYYKLWRARIAPRLGIRLKAFWDKWIRFYLLAD